MEGEWKEFWIRFFEVLNYKLFEIDGNGISLAKLLSGVLLLIVGYAVSRRVSHTVGKRVLSRMPVEDSIRHSLQQLIFYFLLFLTTLFTLRVLNVPITVFTVMGGALAVGVGFGSQNLVNNFISGLLVMVARPIRVGDYIEVDGVSGRVESIGIRATMVRSGQNSLVIIPNTTFIEQKLTNWTSSETVFTSIRIGVAYGTDTEELVLLCKQVLSEVPRILAAPAPEVMFVDFGESALLFDLTFHIPADCFPARKGLESQIRFRLNTVFAQKGVDIPFAVRDVRLKIDGGGQVPKF